MLGLLIGCSVWLAGDTRSQTKRKDVKRKDVKTPAVSKPEAKGRWGPVMPWGQQGGAVRGVVAVHATLLFNGKVLISPRTADANGKRFADKNICDSRVWDPKAPTRFSSTWPSYNIFCSGHCTLANGHVFVAGGHVSDDVGERKATIYDPEHNTWSLVPAMKERRWYPSCVTLSSGDVLVLAGTIKKDTNNQTPQVWQVSGAKPNTWRYLTGAAANVPYYPRLHVAPNGMVFMTGPSTETKYLDTRGAGKWIGVGNRRPMPGAPHGHQRDYGVSVMYAPGKVLTAGGGVPPNASAEIINLNDAKPVWQVVERMHFPRRHHNATVLADGTVFVSGGTSHASRYKDPKTGVLLPPNTNDGKGAVLDTELWDPVTKRWTLLAPQSERRLYHSTALLLPDATVLSAGGGEPWDPFNEKDDHRNAQIFSPPYLFKGPRPTIADAPAFVGYGKQFDVKTPNAAVVRKVTFVRLGSATHACNFDQYFAPLEFKPHKGSLSVRAPHKCALAPPGPYLLFLLSDKGVPSVARIIRLN
jgi:hypothetical protein